MKTFTILAALGFTATLGAAQPAQARGCIKGAIVGGIAGHAAGHGVLGAAGGCVVGRHMANRNTVRNQDAQPPMQQSGAPYGTGYNGGAYNGGTVSR